MPIFVPIQMSTNAAVTPLTHALRTVLTQLEVLCAVVPVATDLAVTASLVEVIAIQYTCRCSVDKCLIDIGTKTFAS